MPMGLTEHIEQAEELVQWLNGFIAELTLPATDRSRIVASCESVALEHHRAIVLNVSVSLHASAAALIRCQFEACVRGAWFGYCAKDAQIDLFKVGRLSKSIPKMVTALEKVDGFDCGALSRTMDEFWDALNDFSHTDLLQVTRQFSNTEIGSNYSDGDVVSALTHANNTALFSAMIIVGIVLVDEETRSEMGLAIINKTNSLEWEGPAHGSVS